MTSQQRRNLRRFNAQRAAATLSFQAGPALGPCPRCKSAMFQADGGGIGQWGKLVAKQYEIVTARVCASCLHELRKAGPGSSLGMHGNAQHARAQEKFARLAGMNRAPSDDEIREGFKQWFFYSINRDKGRAD